MELLEERPDPQSPKPLHNLQLGVTVDFNDPGGVILGRSGVASVELRGIRQHSSANHNPFDDRKRDNVCAVVLKFAANRLRPSRHNVERATKIL